MCVKLERHTYLRKTLKQSLVHPSELAASASDVPGTGQLDVLTYTSSSKATGQ